MIIAWAEKAWEDYLYWQATDKKTLQRINLLIKDELCCINKKSVNFLSNR